MIKLKEIYYKSRNFGNRSILIASPKDANKIKSILKKAMKPVSISTSGGKLHIRNLYPGQTSDDLLLVYTLLKNKNIDVEILG